MARFGQKAYVRAHEDQVRLPPNAVDEHGGDHDDEEVPRPVRGDADGCSACSGFEGEDFRALAGLCQNTSFEKKEYRALT